MQNFGMHELVEITFAKYLTAQILLDALKPEHCDPSNKS